MSTPKFSVREVLPLFFAILIDVLSLGLVFPVLTALFTSDSPILPEHASQALRFWYLGLGFMLNPLFMFFGSSFMGDLSDKWGRKRVLLICMVGLTFGFACMGAGVLLPSLFLLLFGRAFSGLMGASMPIALAAIADLSKEGAGKKAIHISYVALVQSFGLVLGPLMGGILSDHALWRFFNFSVPFFAAAALALIGFFWITFSFEETCVKKRSKIDFLRIFKNFYEAAKHRLIRILGLTFLLMQIAIALYLQLILVYLRERFHYSSGLLGIFNGYFGAWLAIGTLFLLPYFARRYTIEKVAMVGLLLAGICELAAALFAGEIAVWFVAIPLALANQVTYAAMLTSFSNGAHAEHQGWAMGITGATLALSFALTGFSPNLVPYLGARGLIAIGGLLMLVGFSLMLYYCKKLLGIVHPSNP